MWRRRNKQLKPGFAILRSDGRWYEGRSGDTTFWRWRIRNAAIFDSTTTALATIDRITGGHCTHPLEQPYRYEVVPVDRERVFRG